MGRIAIDSIALNLYKMTNLYNIGFKDVQGVEIKETTCTKKSEVYNKQ